MDMEQEIQRLQDVEDRYNNLRKSFNENATLRDQFAMAALNGFAFLKVFTQGNPNANTHEELARYSYELADALLAERSKP